MFSISKNNVSKVSDEIRVTLNRLNTMDDLKLIDSKTSFDILANNEREELVECGVKASIDTTYSLDGEYITL